MITALSNRIGDCLLFGLLGFSVLKSSSLPLLLLLFMSFTKRAQFPFSSWLPAAMAAPTPVSALVHSSTLVTAGVYVLLRYMNTNNSILIIVGTITILIAGACACAESDIKKVVALRTLSQLGLMMFSLGAHQKRFCFFHLLSHACFKALLFLSIGTLIHSLYGSQEYRRYNKLDGTLSVAIISTLSRISLMGFVFTAGFYRKDAILESLYVNGIAASVIIFFLIGVGFTACYSSKMLTATLLMDSYGGPSRTGLGGYMRWVKSPLLILGVTRLVFGKFGVEEWNVLIVNLCLLEKLLPILIISFSFIVGYSISHINPPFLSTLFWLTPNTQVIRRLLTYASQQKDLDKG